MSNLKVDDIQPNANDAITTQGTGNLTTDGTQGNLIIKGTSTLNGAVDINAATECTDVTASGTIQCANLNATSGIEMAGSPLAAGSCKHLGFYTFSSISSHGIVENGSSAVDEPQYQETSTDWSDFAAIRIVLQSIRTSQWGVGTTTIGIHNGSTWHSFIPGTGSESGYPNIGSIYYTGVGNIGTFLDLTIANSNFSNTVPSGTYPKNAYMLSWRELGGYYASVEDSGHIAMAAVAGGVRGVRISGESTSVLHWTKLNAWGFEAV
jgi:hypothetical protein